MVESVRVDPLKNVHVANKYARFGILFDEKLVGFDLFYKFNWGTQGEKCVSVCTEGQPNVVMLKRLYIDQFDGRLIKISLDAV